MNISHYLTSPYFLSVLFELDRAGTILYSRFTKNNEFINMTHQFGGQNFFDESDEFKNIKDFQQIFKSFVNSDQFANNLIFNCELPKKIIPIKVMLIRAYERNRLETASLLS